MSEMKYITIDVDPKSGNTKVEAHGFEGADCLKATLELEQRLGAVENRDAKPELKRRNVLGIRDRIKS